jgi:hypothetical protein
MPEFREHMKWTGKLVIELRDEHGALKERREVDNLVTTVGKGVVADRMKASPTKGAMSHMAVGTGVTAAAVGDTTLQTEVARVALSGTVVTGNQVQYAATFPAGTGTAAITEAGILNASSAGDLLCHTVFGVITKGALDVLTITWTLTGN